MFDKFLNKKILTFGIVCTLCIFSTQNIARADDTVASTTILQATATSTTASSTPTLLTATSTLVLYAINSTSTPLFIATTTPTKNVHNRTEVEALVRANFSDTPIMISIARCETTFRQFADSGNVFRGGDDNNMIGIFQINGNLHRSIALSRGYNIDEIAGNIGYAKYLYSKQGTSPWLASFPCWNDKTSEGTTTAVSISMIDSASSHITPPSSGLTLNLSMGMTNPEVTTLQKLLNSTGYTIATSGPGSIGKETSKFGFLTQEAVRKFQCSTGIVCNGSEYSSGYGFVGSRTRIALLGAPLIVTSTTTVPNLSNSQLISSNKNTTPPSETLSWPNGDNSATDTPEITSLKAQLVILQQKVTELLKQLALLQ